jgi:hypothetical protein
MGPIGQVLLCKTPKRRKGSGAHARRACPRAGADGRHTTCVRRKRSVLPGIGGKLAERKADRLCGKGLQPQPGAFQELGWSGLFPLPRQPT